MALCLNGFLAFLMINQAACARQMGAGRHGAVIQMGTFFLSFSIQNRERLMRLGVLKLSLCTTDRCAPN